MKIRPDIAEFVANLEVFGKRKMNYPMEIGEILQIAFQTGLTKEFEDLIFQAKVFGSDTGSDAIHRL